MVKNLNARQETQVQSLGQEVPLEKEIAEEPGALYSMGSQRVGHDQATNTFTFWTK